MKMVTAHILTLLSLAVISFISMTSVWISVCLIGMHFVPYPWDSIIVLTFIIYLSLIILGIKKYIL